MNPLDALATLIIGWHATSKAFQWVQLCFQIVVSMLGSVLFVTGSALIASRNWPFSIGSGLVSGAVVLVYYVRRSSLCKGMMFAFPEAEAKAEINTDMQVITK
jgi:hypothetical protein